VPIRPPDQCGLSVYAVEASYAQSMTDARFAELDELSTEELRQQAFRLARERRDGRFFWDLFRHLPHAEEAEWVDGNSTGSYGASVEDAIGLWREFTGHDYADQEPVIRAAFIDYLMSHER
jgi:hypothetical protein